MAQFRRTERGAVEIKTVFFILVVLVGILLVVKIAPVYIQQREITYEVDDLARIAAVRSYKKDKIDKAIADLVSKHELQEGSITLKALEQGRCLIAVNYTIPINLWVTTYNWQYDYTANGKEF
jgi:uncharacterized membrane protein